jgi:hypothetical protein
VGKCGAAGQDTEDTESGASPVHAAYLRLLTHTQNMQHNVYLLSHNHNNGSAKASQCESLLWKCWYVKLPRTVVGT